MRNAVTRRPHKERSQISSRQKWGLLEKHKDYSLRAQDYNTKKKKISQLSQKARERNPDEFAFGMISQGKAGLGKHKSGLGPDGEKAASLSVDAVKLLKTQDAGYLKTLAARGRKEIEKVGQEVDLDEVMLGDKRTSRRIVLKDESNQENQSPKGTKRRWNGEVLEASSQEITYPQLPPVSVDQVDVPESPDAQISPSKPKSKKALAAELDAAARLRLERKKRKRLQEIRVAKLEALKKRQREVLAAADELDLQRAKMARTVGGVNKNGVKFKIRERKR
ncbi:hypothetical protein B0A52_08874 [Exophiala mesophila]|uniref:Uncharacterized protein n=1 Tax=Exophiala mesophila TaxID=212818 RepID=A0A438MUU3_EXOME|nr:hypothetical protein B0A52_08874 [Exophiala mesophila]